VCVCVCVYVYVYVHVYVYVYVSVYVCVYVYVCVHVCVCGYVGLVLGSHFWIYMCRSRWTCLFPLVYLPSVGPFSYTEVLSSYIYVSFHTHKSFMSYIRLVSQENVSFFFLEYMYIYVFLPSVGPFSYTSGLFFIHIRLFFGSFFIHLRIFRVYRSLFTFIGLFPYIHTSASSAASCCSIGGGATAARKSVGLFRRSLLIVYRSLL